MRALRGVTEHDGAARAEHQGAVRARGPLKVMATLSRAGLRNARTRPDVAAGLVLPLVFVAIAYRAPLPIVFLGIVLGALSSLVAIGLVLVWRAFRIVNFAQGDIGGVAAILAASLMVGPKWSFFPAALAGLGLAVALGAGTEIFIIRRFATAPRLVLTVATIGIQQLFQGLELGLPKLFNYDVVPNPPQPFSFRFEWFPVTFNGGHLLILVVVPLVVAGLVAFFRYTDIGIAVRAQAESADRAALLGIPTKRIATLVWVMAAGLSALGVLLRLPIQGVGIGAVVGPNVLLGALAAAVIGGMEDLPVTFAASVVLGVVEQSVFFVSHQTIVATAVMFFVILGVLLLRGSGNTGREDDAKSSSWRDVREVRPIPRELGGLPEVRWGMAGLAVASAAFLLFAPLGMTSGTINFLTVGLVFAMVIVSLVVLTGWGGQISLGPLAFAAFGGAVAGTLAQHGKEFFATLLWAGLAGALVALVIGLPALRIRGLFLAVTTLAFAEATGLFFLNDQYFPWLVPKAGIRVLRPVLFDKFDLESEHAYYYFTLLAASLVVGAVWSLRHSRTGRALVALRDNTRAAQAFTINPVRIELAAFAMAGFVAALAGAVFFYHQHGLSNDVLTTQNNFQVFSMAVVGGLGSIPGALLGAAYHAFLENSPLTRSPTSVYFASGVGLLAVLLALPAGLGGLLYDVRDSLLRFVAHRRGIVVPSLVADVATHPDVPSPTPGSVPPSPTDALLRVEGLDVAYGKTQVLFGVDFHVAPGEMVALLGTNGAGKSTLLASIAGLIPPRSGRIVFDGRELGGAGPNQTASLGIALMPGARGVFPSLTVEENLRLAAWLYRRDPTYVRDATERVLAAFPVLRDRGTTKAQNLSGGEQQMLTLGQVLIARPRLLMIDELSLGLAPAVVERLLEIVRRINEQGTAIVLVEQSVNVAARLAPRAVFLEKGEVRFRGATAELLKRPDLARAVFLRSAGTSTVLSRLRKDRFELRCPHCGRERGVALEVHGLTVTYGGIRAVDDVSFGVREGQIVGIIGPNGAGKTTVFDAISGFVPIDEGRVNAGGHDLTTLGPDARAALGLGRSFQDARLFPSMTVREAIATALDRHVEVRDPLAALLMSPAVRASEREAARRVEELISTLHLEAYADKFVGELSTGTRRIVDIACALAHQPSVLLLDEPSSGLAQREAEALGPVLLEVRKLTGAALLVVEHDIPLVSAVSDALVALDLGRVVATGRPAAVLRHPRVVTSYLGVPDGHRRRPKAKRRGIASAGGTGTRVRAPSPSARPTWGSRRY